MLSPLLAVEIAGLVWAIVAMGQPARRQRCLLIAIGLGGFIFVQLGRVVVHRLVITHGIGTGSLERTFTLMNVIGLILDTACTALVVVGGLLGSGQAPDGAGSGAPVGGAGAPEAPRMAPLSTGLRLTLILVPSILGLILSVLGFVVLSNRGDEGVGFSLVILGSVLAIAGGIAMLVSLHALWATIQPPPRGVAEPGTARTTPGAAVGFMFIPLFNFYWVFQAWVGLAADMNKALDARRLSPLHVPRGLAVAICVCAIVSAIPFVGLLTGLANMIMMPLLLSGLFRAANALRTGHAPMTM